MDSALVRRNPEIMSGALCFSGTRVPVKNLFDYLEGSSLHGQHHAGLQGHRVFTQPVDADNVYIKPQPVAGAA